MAKVSSVPNIKAQPETRSHIPTKEMRYCPICHTSRIFILRKFPTRQECVKCGNQPMEVHDWKKDEKIEKAKFNIKLEAFRKKFKWAHHVVRYGPALARKVDGQ